MDEATDARMHLSVRRSADAQNDAAPPSIVDRVDGLDWTAMAAALDAQGCATTAGLLSAAECAALASLYPDEEAAPPETNDRVVDADVAGADSPFRNRVVMARHGFGRGEYRYFRYPLPPTVAALREAFWPRLVPIANRWCEAMGQATRYPATHADYLARCRAAGQHRPTPLMLRYGPGDFNCLHRDLYGDEHFPLQLVVLLDEPGRDFDGGEFVMIEQRPRMQSRPMVLALRRGDAAVFAVDQRPVHGTRGFYRVTMRHGVSRLHAGRRRTLGVIFHDAR